MQSKRFYRDSKFKKHHNFLQKYYFCIEFVMLRWAICFSIFQKSTQFIPRIIFSNLVTLLFPGFVEKKTLKGTNRQHSGQMSQNIQT